MLKWLFFIILLVLSALLAISITASSGNVGLSFSGWTVEAPVWLVVVIILVASGALIVLSRFLKMLCHVGAWLRARRANVLLQKAKNQTNQGLIAWIEEDWSKAEQCFAAGAKESGLPLVNYFAAAHTAYLSGATVRADNYLQLAQEQMQGIKEAKTAIALYQAKQYLAHPQLHQLQQAIDILQGLEKQASAHPKIYQLLTQAYVAVKDWSNLIRILPEAIRVKALTEAQVDALHRQGYGQLLASACDVSLQAVEIVWEAMPKFLRADNELIYDYAVILLHYKESVVAEKNIRQALKKQWDNNLVRLYGKVSSDNPSAQLATAEEWLTQHPQDAVLLLTLGRLCIHNQLWGKAQRYLEASHSLEASADTFIELGNLLARFNKTEDSADYFKRGLALFAEK